MQQALGDLEPTEHPAGIVPGEMICANSQDPCGQAPVDARCPLPSRDAIKTRGQQQVLIAGQRAVGRQQLRHIADVAPHLRRLPDDIAAGDACRSRGRRQQGRQHLDERALAGAIRTDQSKDLAGTDGQAHAVDRGHITEGARQLADLDGKYGERRIGALVRHGHRPWTPLSAQMTKDGGQIGSI